MYSKFYRYCIVPECNSTSAATPNKLFVRVPNKEHIRKKWLKLARRNDALTLSSDSKMYFCEDHFDLSNDMLNYREYQVMGKVSKIRMKPDCLPTKYECQEDRRKRTSSGTERPYLLKKQRMMTIAECLKEYDENCLPSSSARDSSNVMTNVQFAEENIEEKSRKDKSVQALVTNKFRSKAVQTQISYKDQALSPIKPSSVSSYTSPFKVKYQPVEESQPSKMGKVVRKIFTEGEQSDSDISLYTPATRSHTPSVQSLQIQSISDCSELLEEDRKLQARETILNTIKKIEKKPRLYIGVPDTCYFLIEIIKNSVNIPKHHLLLCLQKIRLDSAFSQLADDYEMTPSYLSKIFNKNIPIIASAMQPFIVKLDSELTKKNLPIPFRYKFHDVSCIIDCLEIEIQKSSKAINQALTWSDYKKANTIKYLLSSTPNGLIHFVSPGFGGRTTDTLLVESCDFIKTLKPGMKVLADRGFKHVEQYLSKSGIKLVRPPSVESGKKMSKNEARLTKQIASLRIHIERVIRRVRELKMLKPHACINFNFIKLLDHIMIIACGLVNLQDSLIQ